MMKSDKSAILSAMGVLVTEICELIIEKESMVPSDLNDPWTYEGGMRRWARGDMSGHYMYDSKN